MKRSVVCSLFWLRKRTDFKSSFKLRISCSDKPEERMIPPSISPIDTYFSMRAILLSPLSSSSFHFERRQNNASLLMHKDFEPSTSSKSESLTTGLSLSASAAFIKITSLLFWRISSRWKLSALRKIRQAHVGSSCSWQTGSYQHTNYFEQKCCFLSSTPEKNSLERKQSRKCPEVSSHAFLLTNFYPTINQTIEELFWTCCTCRLLINWSPKPLNIYESCSVVRHNSFNSMTWYLSAMTLTSTSRSTGISIVPE